MIGQPLGHYRILDKLGEGGMGEVYRAEDTKLGREVAIKVLPEEVAADAERLARFEQEARTLAALDHPSIVTIYSVETASVGESVVHFLTMQLIEGDTLDQRILTTRFRSPRRSPPPTTGG
jgi:serine/threonine protein kinase